MNSCQVSYIASIQLVTEGIRLGKCGWKGMNCFVVISIIPFSVFSIPSNSVSVLPCPCSWRLIVLKFNCQNSQFLAVNCQSMPTNSRFVERGK